MTETQFNYQRCRSGKHIVRGPADRVANGQCRQCALANGRRYKRKIHEDHLLLNELAARQG